jgi:hypothetical protein
LVVRNESCLDLYILSSPLPTPFHRASRAYRGSRASRAPTLSFQFPSHRLLYMTRSPVLSINRRVERSGVMRGCWLLPSQSCLLIVHFGSHTLYSMCIVQLNHGYISLDEFCHYDSWCYRLASRKQAFPCCVGGVPVPSRLSSTDIATPIGHTRSRKVMMLIIYVITDLAW